MTRHGAARPVPRIYMGSPAMNASSLARGGGRIDIAEGRSRPRRVCDYGGASGPDLCRQRRPYEASDEMMNMWQEFLYGCQRMPAAPLRRLARTNPEPCRQFAGFAPRQGLRGSVHALPLSAILTTSDQPVHSPDAHVGQTRYGFLLVSEMRRSRGTGWRQAMRSRLHVRIRCEDVPRAVGFVMVRGCQQRRCGVSLVRTRSHPGKMPGCSWPNSSGKRPRNATQSRQCHSVHLPDGRVEQARCGFLLVSGDARIVWKCVVVSDAL